MKAKKTYSSPSVEIMSFGKISFLDSSIPTGSGSISSGGNAGEAASQGKKSYSSPIWNSEE